MSTPHWTVDWLDAYRARRGVTIRQFAMDLNITENVYYRWKNGTTHPHIADVEKMAIVLGLTLVIEDPNHLTPGQHTRWSADP